MPDVPHVYWTATTSNFKTGAVPTAYVGRTREESLRSCEGCPLLVDRNCYAQFGTPALGHSHVIRAAAKGKRYTLDEALAHREGDAKIVRLSAVGEPGRMPGVWWGAVKHQVEAVGLQVLAYVHNWRERPDLAGHAMASCDGPDALVDADTAMDMGFRATVVLPEGFEGRTFTTPKGRKGRVCPAMIKPGEVTCNSCRLCVAGNRGPVIGFPDHGPKRTGDRGEKTAALKARIVELCSKAPRTLYEMIDELVQPPIAVRLTVDKLVSGGQIQRKLGPDGKPARRPPRNNARGPGAFLYESNTLPFGAATEV